ncbi:MAG: V-type ATPase subunit [Candidatus Omnitrophica bacterium]|nr:V-type ATPase subunit [Candidatus Omnitrophota bacterium]
MKISPENYAFAVGKIRALEKLLFKQPAFEEAIESNLPEALRIFAESEVYSDDMVHIKNSRDLEEILDKELVLLRSLVKSLVLDKELLDLVEYDTLTCHEIILRSDFGDFLKDYIKHFIDMHNIKTFLRLYFLKEPQEKLNDLLACDGFIETKDLLKLYNMELSVFLNRLTYVHKHYRMIDYASFLKEPIEKIESEKSFLALEKAMNDFLMEELQPAKYLSFGPEPVLAYYFARLNEINLMRMIILAKLNNAPTEMVKERLNLVYA